MGLRLGKVTQIERKSLFSLIFYLIELMSVSPTPKEASN